MGSYLRTGSEELIDGYSDAALRRVWQATHFSWWMTTMLHPPAEGEPDVEFVRQLQLTQLRYVTSSRTGAAWVAENYTGAAVDALGDV
jgi:p-hydroxybenzoate 3-monooxygenase